VRHLLVVLFTLAIVMVMITGMNLQKKESWTTDLESIYRKQAATRECGQPTQ